MKKDKWWVDKWEVESQSNPGTNHIVARDKTGRFGCSCPAWKFRRIECFHIRTVKQQILVHS